MDYRLRENRREAFIRWYLWSVKYGDCDPSVWTTQYLNDKHNHTIEQRLWLAWIFGTTYQLPTAWVIMKALPAFEELTVDEVKNWNDENYARLRYQTDTKWNKGHLPVMYESYREFIGTGTQQEKFESLAGSTKEETFDNIWNAIRKDLFKFGRYSTWFYMQHLCHTAGVPCVPTSLMLNDYSGSRSHRNGLLLALGMDEFQDKRLSHAQYIELESQAKSILEECINRYPELESKLDFFGMESALCSFKKIFRVSRGRYLGYYLDRQVEEIEKVWADEWTEVDLNELWVARTDTIDSRLDNRQGIDKERFSGFLDTGKIARLEWMFDDEVVPTMGLEGFL